MSINKIRKVAKSTEKQSFPYLKVDTIMIENTHFPYTIRSNVELEATTLLLHTISSIE